MKKLLPILFLLVGVASGVGAGMFLGGSDASEPAEAEMSEAKEMDKDEAKDDGAAKKKADSKEEDASSGSEYVKIAKQFVVPIVTKDHISALATVSLSLEIEEGNSDQVYTKEPKLRDLFLQVLFDHANMGGFDGAFTRPGNLAPLRKALNDVATQELGDIHKDVLIVDIARQDT